MIEYRMVKSSTYLLMSGAIVAIVKAKRSNFRMCHGDENRYGIFNILHNRRYLLFEYTLFLLPQWFTFPTTRESHCNDIYIRKDSKESINLRLHIVLRRYSIQEILDDAEIEVYTECISWKRNPPSCHTIWHHWPDRILFVPYPCMMTTGISCQPEY